jgi:hypothetical protein
VTRQTGFVGLHRRVLEYEGPHGIGVTLGANRKLSGSGPYLVPGLRAVGIMAIAALDEAHINAMTVGPCELGSLLRMATVAELRLRFDEHEVYVVRFVRTVTTGAADPVRQVFGL